MTQDYPVARAPSNAPELPVLQLPAGACDSHVHMLSQPDEFAMWDQRVEDPAPGGYEDWMGRLAGTMTTLGFERVVIVHSILYGADNSITRETVRRLGPSVARGIGLVRDGVSETQLDDLAADGIKGVRLNYVHGGVLSWDGVKAMADRLAARGMHVQMLMHTHLHMQELADDVRALPVPVVFDHIGWPDLSLGVQEPGFQTLCQLVSEGHAYVKLSGAYRVCDAPYEWASEAILALLQANPERCLWGTDWPHIMLGAAKLPDAGALLNHGLPLMSEEARDLVFCQNPQTLYGFEARA